MQVGELVRGARSTQIYNIGGLGVAEFKVGELGVYSRLRAEGGCVHHRETGSHRATNNPFNGLFVALSWSECLHPWLLTSRLRRTR